MYNLFAIICLSHFIFSSLQVLTSFSPSDNPIDCPTNYKYTYDWQWKNSHGHQPSRVEQAYACPYKRESYSQG